MPSCTVRHYLGESTQCADTMCRPEEPGLSKGRLCFTTCSNIYLPDSNVLAAFMKLPAATAYLLPWQKAGDHLVLLEHLKSADLHASCMMQTIYLTNRYKTVSTQLWNLEIILSFSWPEWTHPQNGLECWNWKWWWLNNCYKVPGSQYAQ